jgi:biopolymer transport protein ExbD
MLLRRQVSEERDEHIDMTPMVDVVFQLMTFMLFSVQMSGGEKVEVPPARHGVGVEENAATFLTVLRPDTPGAEPRVVIGVGDNGSAATMEDIRKAILDGIKDNKRRVVLQADGAVPHGEVLKLAGVVSEMEGVTLHIGVQEPQ